MKSHPNRCAVFDLDGTLIDSREDIAGAVNLLRARFGLAPLPTETVVSFVGNGIRKLVERAFEQEDPALVEKAKEQIVDCYRETLVVKTTLYPGVADGLRILKTAGFKLAIATNKPHVLCVPLLKKLGIADCFDAILGGGTKIRMKPEPDQIHYVMKETLSSPERTWMLGDNYTDLAAGRAAGCKRAFAAWGFGDPRQESWDFKADSFLAFVYHLLKS